MFVQVGVVGAEINQDRIPTEDTVSVPPKSVTIVVRLIMLIIAGLVLSILSVVLLARTGTAPKIFEPPLHLLPGDAPPKDIHCGESADEACYPPVDAHCHESGDAGWGCFTSASTPYNGKKIAILIDVASRTIALTSISAPGYTMGDLILAWGTPTEFNQSGRAIDVYWGARSASLTTCSFRPESRVDIITYYRSPAFAAPWHGFVRVNSKDC
ncbi:MAG: hypothetical protein ACYDBJ_08270 [Aggregatilineales bacterium]